MKCRCRAVSPQRIGRDNYSDTGGQHGKRLEADFPSARLELGVGDGGRDAAGEVFGAPGGGPRRHGQAGRQGKNKEKSLHGREYSARHSRSRRRVGHTGVRIKNRKITRHGLHGYRTMNTSCPSDTGSHVCDTPAVAVKAFGARTASRAGTAHWPIRRRPQEPVCHLACHQKSDLGVGRPIHCSGLLAQNEEGSDIASCHARAILKKQPGSLLSRQALP